MNDDTLKILALISVIFGLACLFIFILDYEPKDSYFLFEDDNNAYIYGMIKSIKYNDETHRSIIIMQSCREFPVSLPGSVNKSIGDQIKVNGEYIDGFLFSSNIN